MEINTDQSQMKKKFVNAKFIYLNFTNEINFYNCI